MSQDDKDIRATKISAYAAVITAVIGLLGVIVSSILGARITSISLGGIEFQVPTQTPTPIVTTLTPSALTPVAQDINSRVSNVENELKLLRQEVAVLNQNISSGNSNTDTTALQRELKDLDSRIGIIEKFVLDNPNKALELTMLNSEMDNLKVSYEKDLENTRKEIDRIYDLNKWFIGLMFTMAVGLISMSVSNFMKKPEPAKESPQSKKNASGSKTG